MSHFYKTKYLEIYNKQPDTLTDIEKLIRIDRLAAAEAGLEHKMNIEFDPTWYFTLCTILTQEYLARAPYITDFPVFKNIATNNLRYMSLRPIAKIDDKTMLQHVKDRRQLTDLIEEAERHGRQDVKRQRTTG